MEKDLIEMVVKAKPDLIIMDIIMPVMNGFEATKILKASDRTKKIPIIGLDNLGQKEDIDKAYELGMEEYFINAESMPTEFVEEIKKYF